MAQVKNLIISFQPSPSPDVAGYRLYMIEAPAPVDYNAENFDLGAATEVDISTLAGMTTKSGTYNIGVAAYDQAGNLSSLSIEDNVVLDFLAPDPPGAITVSRL